MPFQRLNIEFDIAREVPVNYDEVVLDALDNARTTQDTNNILSALIHYGMINDYLNQPRTHIFTSNILSVTLTGDRRDNLFNTTSGAMTTLSVDGINPIFLYP